MYDVDYMLGTVCHLIAKKEGGYSSGQGVLLLPDVLLTSFHNLRNSKDGFVKSEKGLIARANPSCIIKKDENADLAIIELSKPVSSNVAVFSDETDFLTNKSGYLVTSFSGKAEAHPAGLDLSRLQHDFILNASHGWRSYISDNVTKPGISGAPVFDSRGYLVSINHGFQHDGRLPKPESSHSFFGPSPIVLRNFIRNALDL